MAMKLQRTTLVEKGKHLVVEVAFAETTEWDENSAVVLIRLPIEKLQHPRAIEARLEALVFARSLISEEIQAIEQSDRENRPAKR